MPESELLLPARIDVSGPFPVLKRRLRLGVVGGGRIAATQATAARLTNQWEVTAGALSSDPDRARIRGADWYLPADRCYASFEAMAKAEATRADGVDAVMITTPNHMHAPAAQAFLNAGIDVLCDKPMTNTQAEARDLVDTVASTGCVFGVGYTMSCFPMVRQARALVAQGALGRLNQIHVEFMQDWMVPEASHDAPHVKWRLDPAKSGKTSCVGDIGTHAAHLAQFVSGLAMTDLRAEFHVCGAPKPLEDTVFMATRYAGPVPGTLMATRLAPGNRGGLRLRVYGSEGGLAWDLENCDRLYVTRFGEPDQVISRGQGHGVTTEAERLTRAARGFPEGIIEAWGNLYQEFAMAVAARRDGRECPDGWLNMPTVEDGARGVDFVEAAWQSNQAGGAWVALPVS